MDGLPALSRTGLAPLINCAHKPECETPQRLSAVVYDNKTVRLEVKSSGGMVDNTNVGNRKIRQYDKPTIRTVVLAILSTIQPVQCLNVSSIVLPELVDLIWQFSSDIG